MYCVRCGGKIGNTDRFCPNCGERQGAPPNPPDGYARKQGLPGWAWALIIFGVLFFFAIPIIGIIGAIAVPTMISTRQAALYSYAEGISSTVRSAEAAYFAAKGEYGGFSDLVNDQYLDSRFYSPQEEIRNFDGRPGVIAKIELTSDKKSYEFTIRVDDTGVFKVKDGGEIERVYD